MRSDPVNLTTFGRVSARPLMSPDDYFQIIIGDRNSAHQKGLITRYTQGEITVGPNLKEGAIYEVYELEGRKRDPNSPHKLLSRGKLTKIETPTIEWTCTPNKLETRFLGPGSNLYFTRDDGSEFPIWKLHQRDLVFVRLEDDKKVLSGQEISFNFNYATDSMYVNGNLTQGSQFRVDGSYLVLVLEGDGAENDPVVFFNRVPVKAIDLRLLMGGERGQIRIITFGSNTFRNRTANLSLLGRKIILRRVD